ncbi:hypothetical protein J6590_105413 [Homalodisca vitripennis]|nr:hypothetical protein J6590_105413 [Homalodisca vitripennis]
MRTMFLPSNVTSLIQPMDQGVLETLKKSTDAVCCNQCFKLRLRGTGCGPALRRAASRGDSGRHVIASAVERHGCPQTLQCELNARVASLGTENQDLKTLITKLTSRLDAIESASIKSAASQAELSKKLDILDVAAKKISHSDAELKEKIENLNTTCFELIKVISGVEERLKALESGHVNSKLTIIGFNARLDTMERMMMPCHDNTLENNPVSGSINPLPLARHKSARPPHSHCSLNGTDRHALLYPTEPISAALE